MIEKGTEQQKKHTLVQTARTHVAITGVSRVNSFDEQSVLLVTDCGELCIEGEGLHVAVLDVERGVVELDGRISAVLYSDAVPQRRTKRARLLG